jgi:hypothetical protein
MTKPSIPVVMSDSHITLDKASRIYYGIHHPVQYNAKVKDIGYVPRDLIPTLIGNWREEDERDTQQEAEVTANAELSDDEEEEEEGKEERDARFDKLRHSSFKSLKVRSNSSKHSGTISLMTHATSD